MSKKIILLTRVNICASEGKNTLRPNFNRLLAQYLSGLQEMPNQVHTKLDQTRPNLTKLKPNLTKLAKIAIVENFCKALFMRVAKKVKKKLKFGLLCLSECRYKPSAYLGCKGVFKFGIYSIYKIIVSDTLMLSLTLLFLSSQLGGNFFNLSIHRRIK